MTRSDSSLLACSFLLGLSTAACVLPVDLVDEEATTTSDDASGSTGTDAGSDGSGSDGSDGSGSDGMDDESSTGAEPCPEGSPGCACAPGDGCDDGHACADSVCVPLEGPCGNGVMDPGEDCDDGNLTDADGCNADCRVSASLVLSTTFGDGIASAVAVDSTDAILVGGSQTVDAEATGWVRKLDPAAGELWLDELPVDRSVEMATGPDDRVLAGCSEDGPFGYGSFCVRSYSAGGVVEQTTEEDWNRTEAVAIAPDGLLLAGSADRLYVYDGGGGGSGWVLELAGDLDAMALRPDGSFAAAGAIPEVAQSSWVAMYPDASAEAEPLWSQDGPPGRASGVAVDGEGNVVVVVTGSSGGIDAWMQKLAPDGTERWTVPMELYPEQEQLNGVAIDSHDRIVVAGHLGPGSGDDAWIGKYDPDGQLLWTVIEDDGTAQAVAIDSEDEIVVVGTSGGEAWLAIHAP